MRREDRFLISRAPYAVDLTSLARKQYSTGEGPWKVTAAWFRRRRGVTVACVGELWDYQTPAPTSVVEFLERHDDGRYGGDCQLRWDGGTLWTDGKSFSHAESESLYAELLRPMLENYPAAPPSFDGWWTFRAEADRG